MFSNNSNNENNVSNWTNDEVDYMQEQQRKQQVTINEQMLTIGDMEAKVRTMENNARVLNGIIETKTNAQREMESDMFQLREQIKAHRQVIDDQARKIENMQRDIAYGKRLHEEETTRANKYASDIIVMTSERDALLMECASKQSIIDSMSAEHDRVVAMWKQSETKIREHNALISTLNMENVQKDEQIAALEEQVKYLRRVEMRFDALRDHAQSINGPLVEYGDEGEVEAQKPKRKVHIDFDAIDEDFEVEDDEDIDDAISRIIEELKGRLDEADAEVIKEYDDEARRDALARHSIMELMTYVIDNDIDMLGHEFNSAALFKYDLIDAIVIDETSDDDE